MQTRTHTTQGETIDTCPSCLKQFVIPPGDPATVNCPHCRETVVVRLSLPANAVSIVPPPIVVLQPQTTATGPRSWSWFSRSFLATTGVLAAISLFTISVVGVLSWRSAAAKASARRLSGDAYEVLSTQLLRETKPFGITAIADRVRYGSEANDWEAIAVGRGSDGKLHDLVARWRVATFGAETRWELQTLRIDDRLLRSQGKWTQTGIAKHAERPKEWKSIFTVHGRESQETRGFEVTRKEARLRWQSRDVSAETADKAKISTLLLTLVDEGGNRPLQIGARDLAGERAIDKPGKYTLSIAAYARAYDVFIEQRE